jgi:hypothetical protein
VRRRAIAPDQADAASADVGGGWLMFSRIAVMRALNEKRR